MEFTDEMYHNEKLRRYYGLSLWVDPAKAREHVAALKSPPYYMTNRRIAQLAGICESNLCQLIRGRRNEGRDYAPVNEIHRATEAAILGVQPEIDPQPGGGGRLSPVGSRRRLQALVALGYPLAVLSQGIEWGSGPQPVHRFIRGKSGTQFIMHSTHLRVCALYDKLAYVDPADMGIGKVSVDRAKKTAAKWGYAPPFTWDDDTIDDPDAAPEWTGHCGTRQGRAIHKRDGIPMCDACRHAPWRLPSAESETYEFDGDRLEYLMTRNDETRQALAEALGLSAATVAAWRQGLRQPSLDRLEDIAEHFGVHVSELKR